MAQKIAFLAANREQLPDPVIPIGLLYVMASTPKRHPRELWDLCFAKEPIGGITPMQGMLDAMGLPEERRPWRIDGKESAEADWQAFRNGEASRLAALTEPYASDLRPISTPLNMGGIAPSVRAFHRNPTATRKPFTRELTASANPSFREVATRLSIWPLLNAAITNWMESRIASPARFAMGASF